MAGFLLLCTALKLLDGDKLVRLMPLRHTPRPAHQRRNANLVEQAAFRAKRDGGKFFAAAPLRQPAGEVALRIGQQAGIGPQRLKRDLALRRPFPHRGQQLVAREGRDILQHAVDIGCRQRTQLKIELAILRHDIERRAALNGADLQRAERRIEARVLRLPQRLADADDMPNQLRRLLNGVDALRRIGGMAGAAAHLTAHRHFALMAVNRLHCRGFADNAERGLFRRCLEMRHQRAHAQAADLLIVRESQMQRHPQRLC
ncbi:MAG: hypothetical protein E6662_00595 [Pantoea sp.]|nr:hypothetical protein [Pantoea sp.]